MTYDPVDSDADGQIQGYDVEDATDIGTQYLSSPGQTQEFELGVDIPGSGGGGSGFAIPDAFVYLDSGTPTAIDQNGTTISSGADAGAVIQAASDDVGVGGTIQVGTGTFSCDTIVNLHESQWLRGNGMWQTTLQATASIADHLIQSQDDDASGRNERLRCSEMTIDMDNQGYSAIFLFVAQDCMVDHVNAINAGDRSGGSSGGILLRNSFNTDGFNHWIINNRTENCTNVSIDCGAGGTDPGRAIVYGNRIFDPSDLGQFTHGISVENVDNSTVSNNICKNGSVNGGSWSPALNINAASRTTVSGNTIIDASLAIATANGPGYANVYSANTVINSGFVQIKTSGAGPVRDNLIVGNTFDGDGGGGSITIGDDAHADIVGNLFRNRSSSSDYIIDSGGRNPEKAVNVIGNTFQNCTGKLVWLTRPNQPSGQVFANNHFEDGLANTNAPIIDLECERGICTGNYFGVIDDGAFHQTIKVGNQSGDRWLLSNNYIRGDPSFHKSARVIGDGMVQGNIFDDGYLDPGDADVRNNVGFDATISNGNQNYDINSDSRLETYTGDGTTGRVISTSLTPDYVVVEDSGGTKYDVHSQWGNGYLHSAPAGELSIVDGGFQIGDNTADADPNTTSETYTFYAR